MCGLVGIAGNLATKDEATMQRLFLLDHFRGKDSTGLAAIRMSGEAALAKISSHSLDLFEMPRFRAALNGTQSKAFIGHNRAATRGGVSSSNAHPYQFDHIIGAHNGTLDTEGWLALDEILGEKYPVDSMSIFAAIAKVGVEEVIPKLPEGKDYQTGAWSLVWYDQHDGTLNFLRNKHRPLWYAFNEELDRIFWASEWEMIDAATKMSPVGYKLFAEGKEGYKFFQTEPDVHYKLVVSSLYSGNKERPKMKAKTLKGKEPKPVATSTVHPFVSKDLSGSGRTATTNGGRTGSTTTSRGSANDDITVVHLLGDMQNPYAGVITEEKFKALAAHGCSYCGTDVEYGELGCTIFDRDDILLCPACTLGNTTEKGFPVNRVHTRNMDFA